MGQLDNYRTIYKDGFNRGYKLAKAYVIGPPPKKVMNHIIKHGKKVHKMGLLHGMRQWEKEFDKTCEQQPFLDFKKGLEQSMKTKDEHEREL